MRVGISTRIKLEIVNSKTGAVRQGPGPFPNMILDVGLDRMRSQTQANIFSQCRLGTGTLEPSAGQTGLTNPVGNFTNNRTDSSSNSGGAPWWHQLTRTFEFPPAVDEGTAGLPISEIEFRETANDTSTCWARALIRDSQGNPTTIVLLDDEILRVVYSVRNNVPMDDVSGVVAIAGEDYNFAARAMSADMADRWGPSSFEIPTRTSVSEEQTLRPITGFAPASDLLSYKATGYVSGSFESQFGGVAGVGVGNFGSGIGSILGGRVFVSSLTALVQCSVSRVSDGSGIPKTSDDILVLNDFFTFSWGRA